MPILWRGELSDRRCADAPRARSAAAAAARAHSTRGETGNPLSFRPPLPMPALRRHCHRWAAADVDPPPLFRLRHRSGAGAVWFVRVATARGAKARQPLGHRGRNGRFHVADGAAVDGRRPRWPIISGCPTHPRRLDASAGSSPRGDHTRRLLAALARYRGPHRFRVSRSCTGSLMARRRRP